MNKKRKSLIIGLFSVASLTGASKLISFPDEKLTSGSLTSSELKRNSEKKISAKSIAELEKGGERIGKNKLPHKKHQIIEKVIKNGISRMGTLYLYGGITEKGFDCSGFVHYAFSKVNINVPHSSKMLAETGQPIKRKETRKGDILIFTGTNPSDRSPGHVGIVISKAGEAIKFVHSSSNGGVKISQVEGTNYEKRFLETRRVL